MTEVEFHRRVHGVQSAFPGVGLRATPGYDLAPLQGDRVSAAAIFKQPCLLAGAL